MQIEKKERTKHAVLGDTGNYWSRVRLVIISNSVPGFLSKKKSLGSIFGAERLESN